MRRRRRLPSGGVMQRFLGRLAKKALLPIAAVRPAAFALALRASRSSRTEQRGETWHRLGRLAVARRSNLGGSKPRSLSRALTYLLPTWLRAYTSGEYSFFRRGLTLNIGIVHLQITHKNF